MVLYIYIVKYQESIPSVLVELPKKTAMRRYKMISQINTNICCEHLVHD